MADSNPTCATSLGITPAELRRLVGTSSQADPLFNDRVAQAMENLGTNQRQAIYRAAAIRRTLSAMRNTTETSPARQLQAILSHDRFERHSGVTVEDRQFAIIGQAHREMAELMEHHRPNLRGFSRDPEGLRNLILELRGRTTGDNDAVAYARAYRTAADALRERANRAGADIGFIEDWGTPQYHVPARVAQVSADEWIAFITPKLDMARSFANPLENGGSYDPNDMLRHAYASIASDGLTDVIPGQAGGGVGTSVANRLGFSRQLHFKDAESWLDYQDRFGSENYYTALIDHIDRLARNVSLMEVFGPNPDWGFNYLVQTVQKAEYDKGNAQAITSTRAAENVYANIRGMARPGNSTVANVFATARSFIAATRLGTAFLSAIPDLGFSAVTAKYNSMSAFNTVVRTFSNFIPGNKSHRLLASRLGMVAEYALDRAISSHRYVESTPQNAIGRISDQTMRMSFLQPWTMATRRAFTLEFYANLWLFKDISFDKLPRGLTDSFRRGGITQLDWDALRTAPPEVSRGVSYVNPGNLEGHSELQIRIAGLVNHELNYVSPTDLAATRALVNQGHATGTFAGELLRTVAQFKSFGITQLLTHLSRMMHGKGMNRGAYTASIIITTGILGMVSYQAKLMADGKEPMHWDDPKLWWRGLVAGGFGGILTDLLNTDVNGFERAMSSTLVGPLTQAVVDDLIARLIMGNSLDMVMEDMESHWGPEAVNLIKRNIPYIGLWQWKLAMNRLVMDQLESLVDPEYDKKVNNRLKRYNKDTDQDYYWEPGETKPVGM